MTLGRFTWKGKPAAWFQVVRMSVKHSWTFGINFGFDTQEYIPCMIFFCGSYAITAGPHETGKG
jgi:hypothetical protein